MDFANPSWYINKMSARCDFTFEEVDFLLKRNWSIDMADLHDMIAELPEDVYYEVLQHRNEYAPNVRWAFHEPEIPQRFLRLKVRDMSDEEWESKLSETRRELMSKLKKHKETFQPPPRPVGAIDGYVAEAKTALEECKKELENASRIARRTQRYVPPGMRGYREDDTPAVAKARTKVENAENGLKRLQAQLETQDMLWNDQACRDAF